MSVCLSFSLLLTSFLLCLITSFVEGYICEVRGSWVPVVLLRKIYSFPQIKCHETLLFWAFASMQDFQAFSAFFLFNKN